MSDIPGLKAARLSGLNAGLPLNIGPCLSPKGDRRPIRLEPPVEPSFPACGCGEVRRFGVTAIAISFKEPFLLLLLP